MIIFDLKQISSGNMEANSKKPVHSLSTEQIIAEIRRQNVLEKIMLELSKLIEKKDYEQEFGKN
jgi:hypothetical protein